jgi:hypothetical protein
VRQEATAFAQALVNDGATVEEEAGALRQSYRRMAQRPHARRAVGRRRDGDGRIRAGERPGGGTATDSPRLEAAAKGGPARLPLAGQGRSVIARMRLAVLAACVALSRAPLRRLRAAALPTGFSEERSSLPG